jgi:hypothetical protein
MMRAFVAGTVFAAACSNSHVAPPAGAPDAHVALPGDGSVAGDGAIAGDGAVADAYVDRGVEQDYDDLATTIAGAVRSTQLQAMADGINFAYNDSLPGFTTVQAGEISGTRGAVSYDYMFHCEDQQAQDNFTCGPASNHIHWMATIDGPVMIDALSFPEYKLTTHWTIREIYLNKPQVEDTDRLMLTADLASDGTRFQLTIDGTNFDHVRLDPQPALPFGGAITYAVTAMRTRATATPAVRSYTATATMTFAAGGQATIDLDGTHSYTVDLSTGAVTRM